MIEILSNVSALLFGFWVLFPLSALQNVLAGRGNWRTQLRKIPRNLLLFWSLFAFLRLILFIWPVPIWSLFVPEPLGTALFFVAGVICLLLWLLVERTEGVQIWRQSYGTGSTRTVPRAVAEPTPLCPECGVPMVLRTARRGKYQGHRFYGCPNYPDCRGMIVP